MSKMPSIFDTPLPAEPKKQKKRVNESGEPDGAAQNEKQAKKKKTTEGGGSTSKKQLIDQVMRELNQGNAIQSPKKVASKKKNNSAVEIGTPKLTPKNTKKNKSATNIETSTPNGVKPITPKQSAKKDSSSKDSTPKGVDKKKKAAKKSPKKGTKPAGLKIKLQDLNRHKTKLRKSLNALNQSKKAKTKSTTENSSSHALQEASFDDETFKSNLNNPMPIIPGAVSQPKPAKKIAIPLPLDFTPSKVKQEPKTPKASAVAKTLLPENQEISDSYEVGRTKFGWVIHPVTVDEFMAQHWEKKPLLIQRGDSEYFKSLLSRKKIDDMLRTNNIEYTKNIDITSYREGKRETHNPDGRVLPPDMWAFYEEGCSVRMLNPQTYLPEIYEMNVKLQEFFHCMTGANFYLTPPNSQGFAPHFDDIEAFVLQIEGRKHWKLYSPRVESEVLARFSSPNFEQSEIGNPILEVTLEPGDLLYFPRGIIHQASTVPGHHSLHVTMSVYQKNSWTDLLEYMLPQALALASEKHIALRQGIPLDFHQHFGIVHSDSNSTTREAIIEKFKAFIDVIFTTDALDAAADQLAKRFQHDALPPLIEKNELPKTVYGNNYDFKADGTVKLKPNFTDKTTVRLLRRNILRLVNEEDKLRIYYHMDNSREYHEFEPNFLEIDQDAAIGVELLVKVYPKAIAIADLPVDDRIEFAKSLWEKGLILLNV
ncbi:bifunctional lysine-specific demethylase and histidyl-hydroxylase NO66-like isoform X2 [Uranotaenia lowii]|uniref:bifunctional lysine-specific demethylase and histidyl-hydroxylase NO66-like isoform X2 n=1 Tax=Uranotaenia lowii TaxID=190385 RepID=UPI00247B17C9|nr:bifunctional lysine-specific demethylase and histidyl-hydroxylase NO66-like isoform X2 [Uranotaenia lowii]